ncbi:MAG: hypothetical protein ACRCW6_03170 [Mycoplasmoidaceae bacterium]
MNEILLYLILKYKSSWIKIFKALKNKEMIPIEKIMEAKNMVRVNFISMIDNNYPDALKQIYKPPFGFFALGDINLLKLKKLNLVGFLNNIDSLSLNIDKNDYSLIINLQDYNLNQIKLLLNLNYKLILVSSNGINTDSMQIQKLNNKNILILSEYYSENYFRQNSFQPFERIAIGLSNNLIINYQENIPNIDLILEIAKIEAAIIYNYKNCPKKVIKKYNIKQFSHNHDFVFLKN